MFAHFEVAPGVVTVWCGGYPVAYAGMGFGRRALRSVLVEPDQLMIERGFR